MDRVTDYESVGQGFESLPAYQEISISHKGMLISIVNSLMYAPVAQLDRVTDYESVGQGFESLPAYQKADTHLGICFFIMSEIGLSHALQVSDTSRRAVDETCIFHFIKI